MNEHYENYDMDEMEIDLIDFLFYLLRRWKSLVAMILLGAILGSAFYVVKITKSSNAAVEDYQPDADTEANMKLAAQYRKLYDQQMDYNEHSIVMQMDPNQVYEGTLTFYLSAGEYTEVLAQLFANIIDDQILLNEIKQVAGLDCEDQYVKELIADNVSQQNMNVNEGADSTVNVVNNITVSSDSLSNTVIDYQIAYSNQETCEKMIEVLKNTVENAAQKYAEIYGNYEFRLVQSTVSLTTEPKYLEKQRVSTSLIDKYLTELSKLEKPFEGTSLEYYKTVIINENQFNETSESKQTYSTTAILKWIILFLAIFAFIWFGVILVIYLISPCIKNEREIVRMNIPVIGCLDTKNEKNKLIRFLQKGMHIRYDSTAYIIQAIEAFDAKKVIIANRGDFEKQIISDIVVDLKNAVNKEYLQISGMSIGETQESDGIIYVIEKGKTTYIEIQRELSICKVYGISILGAIIVD